MSLERLDLGQSDCAVEVKAAKLQLETQVSTRNPESSKNSIESEVEQPASEMHPETQGQVLCEL